jgi:PAS domain S-box-containing protein
MSTPTIDSELFEPPQFPTRQVLYWMAFLLAIAAVPFLIWPILADRILAANFLPHLYCYLGKPGLVWTHVIADSLIGLSYVMISGTLAYLAQKGRRDIPFHYMFLAFGSFIVACGGTHFMEAVTVWVPVYVLSAILKVGTALVSVTTAVLLPFTVPRVLSLVQTARASEAAEAKFHQMADNIQEIFWMVDAITKQVIYVNPAFEQITGRTCTSLQGAPLSYHEIIHQDDRARVLSRFDEAPRTGKFDEEFRITRPDGTIRWVGAQGFPIRDAQGNIYRLAGVVQDITERKRADEGLRRSEAEARARAEELAVILDAVPGMALIARDTACHTITGSRAAYDLLRLPYGANISKSAPEGEKPTNFRAVKDGRELCPDELPLQRAVATGQEVRGFEMILVLDDGNSHDLFGNAAPLLDQKGEVRGGVGVFVDITDRKRAEEALRESEERFRLAAQAGKMFAYEWDAATDVIVRSAESAQILGIDEATHVTGRQILTKVHPDDRDRLSAAAAELSPEKPHLQISYRMVRPDGTVIWVERNSRAHFDEHGRMLRIVGMVADITERKRVEEALRESEDRYRDLVEHSQDLLCTHDLEGKLLSTNPAPARILGYESAELLKIPMRELIAPEYREQFDQYLVRLKTAGMDKGLMAVVTRTGGRRIWEYNNTLRTEGVPSPIVRGMAHDITDRIRAEREMRASEERFRQLAENIREVFYLTDLQRHCSLYISPAYEEVWGRTCQSLYEDLESFMEAIYPDDRDAARRAYGSRQPFMHEYRIVRPDGSMRWIWDRGFPIRDEKGEVYRLAGIAEDITERKRAEESLQLFRMLIDQSNDAIEVIDPETLRFIDINGRDCLDLGYTREELLSMSVYDVDPDLDEPMLARVNDSLRESGSAILESLHRRKDGSTFPVEVSIKQVHLDRSYFVSVARDITERKQAEQALQESQAALARVTRIETMGELTASIAHEINQPLAAVVTNGSASLRWLAMQPPNLKEARKAVTSAIRDANRASDVIKRIRALLQKEQPQLRPLDGNEAIREVVLLAESELLGGRVTVKTELAADVPTVLGDRVQLQQVILNLIMNGIDAMSTISDRPRELLIQSAAHPEGVLIQVQDSGTGLDLEQAGRIFEPFFTTKPQGIGMGLSISRSIVEAHGGRLWATPGSPYGAVFQLILPKADSSDD